MKRKNLIPSLILIALLLAMLLPGCQNPTAQEASAPTISEPLAAESTVNPSDATEITDVPATELPEPDTESTLATEAPDETQIEPETTAPTEPKATEPKSSEPKPAEPKPSESKPAEPKPSESKPTEPKPSEPKPSQPKPSDPKPSEPKPSEPKPTEPPHSHSWGAWKQTKAPTCASSGEEARSCACGATETRPVAATGKHSWQETSPTCTQEGVKTCTVCGKKETIAALGHDWVHHDEVGHWRDVLTCYCGKVFYSYDEWCAHSDYYCELYLNGELSEEDNIHGGYSDRSEWVVDKPAYDVCSRCGAVK